MRISSMFLPLLFLASLADGQSTVNSNIQDASLNGYCSSVQTKLDTLIALFGDKGDQKEDVKGYLPGDCKQILDSGLSTGSGVYTIYNPVEPQLKREVYCDMETDGGGWLVFQRRVSDAVNFDRIWAEYVTGFGDITGNVWLGNELLYRLTNYRLQELRVELENWENVTAYANYQAFRMDTETNKYRLSVSGYTGSAGDSLSYHDGANFCTKDRDYDTHETIHCASHLEGAWWFKSCEHSSLNGPYYPPGSNQPDRIHGVSWDTFAEKDWGPGSSLKMSEMKIRAR